ncbi:unnamed protein product [Nezara viridula]|uniref:Uncharacterized protein n=1 Tax=Nezara viridula TaxID=85310 RepID=A0A9P0EBK7_NEZVI|nr:unnamed protein product [Nezara viridula]
MGSAGGGKTLELARTRVLRRKVQGDTAVKTTELKQQAARSIFHEVPQSREFQTWLQIEQSNSVWRGHTEHGVVMSFGWNELMLIEVRRTAPQLCTTLEYIFSKF